MGKSQDEIVVSDLWLFPIKSCRGTQIKTSGYTETGLNFDRQWMIVEELTHKFLTARVIGRMVLIHPTLDLASETLTIHIPSYQSFPATSHSIPLTPPTSASAESDFQIWGGTHEGTAVGTPELLQALSDFMGKKVLLIQKGNTRREGGYDAGWVETLGIELDYEEGAAIKWNDAFPILLCSESSLAEIGDRVSNDPRVDKQRWNEEGVEKFEIQRFRGNVVVKGAEAWTEDSWSEIRIGESQEEMVVAARCARCMLPNVDPATGVRDKIVPDIILRPYRQVWDTMGQKVCFGVNLIPRKSVGTISVGDKILVSKSFSKRLEGESFDRPEDGMTI